ncbi:MAG TPA: hypothetical protein PKM78_02370, partial [Anaerolineae bacterium]|nr:hypothetical protein [Anaerolineae bacterium]
MGHGYGKSFGDRTCSALARKSGLSPAHMARHSASGCEHVDFDTAAYSIHRISIRRPTQSTDAPPL